MPAGWGFVIIEQNKAQHEVSGPVTTDPESYFYQDAVVGSNNTRELSATMEAALYILGLDKIPSEVEFVYDVGCKHNHEKIPPAQK